MEVEQPFLASLIELGFPLSTVGSPRRVYNTLNVVAAMTISDVVPALQSADDRRGGATQFGDYFKRPFDSTLAERDVITQPIKKSADVEGGTDPPRASS